MRTVSHPLRLLLTSYDLKTQEPFTFDSAKAALNRSENYLLSQAILASSAQPAAFKPAVIKNANGEERFCDDNGIAVNPVVIGIIAAEESLREQKAEDKHIYNTSQKNIKIISVGTGFFEQDLEPKKMKYWGVVQSALPEINGLLGGIRKHNTQIVKSFKYAEAYRLDILLDSGSELADDDISSTMLQQFRDKATAITQSDEYLKALDMIKKTL